MRYTAKPRPTTLVHLIHLCIIRTFYLTLFIWLKVKVKNIGSTNKNRTLRCWKNRGEGTWFSDNSKVKTRDRDHDFVTHRNFLLFITMTKRNSISDITKPKPKRNLSMQLQQAHHHAEKEKLFWDRVHDFVTPRNFSKIKSLLSATIYSKSRNLALKEIRHSLSVQRH